MLCAIGVHARIIDILNGFPCNLTRIILLIVFKKTFLGIDLLYCDEKCNPSYQNAIGVGNTNAERFIPMFHKLHKSI